MYMELILSCSGLWTGKSNDSNKNINIIKKPTLLTLSTVTVMPEHPVHFNVHTTQYSADQKCSRMQHLIRVYNVCLLSSNALEWNSFFANLKTKYGTELRCLILKVNTVHINHKITALDKMLFSIQNGPKVLIFLLFLHENICCGYSLEAPQWGTSNEYSQHIFSWRNKQNINLIPTLI